MRDPTAATTPHTTSEDADRAWLIRWRDQLTEHSRTIRQLEAAPLDDRCADALELLKAEHAESEQDYYAAVANHLRDCGYITPMQTMPTSPMITAPRMIRPRRRGAGRPARRATCRTSARSGDSDPEPPPSPVDGNWWCEACGSLNLAHGCPCDTCSAWLP